MDSKLKTFTITTFGCKVNQYESFCIADDFVKNGLKKVSFNSQADIYIINTCTVTNRTDYKSRNAIRKALRFKEVNPHTKVIVTGCYSHLNSQQIATLGDVDYILDNKAKGSVFDIMENGTAHKLSACSNNVEEELFQELFTDEMPDKARAFIKIQDGCNFFCSYCIVPFARGKPRSRKPYYIIHQIKRLVTNGYKEFVIAGINLGLYGKDLITDNENTEKYTLTKILTLIEKIQGVVSIRISSIEPQLIDDELLQYIKSSSKLCPHFHIPLQSGSDTLLKSMKRSYSTDDYASLINEIKTINPNAAIGTDIILGYPGETDSYFEDTYEFVNRLPLTYAHIFPYSPRKGTSAASMPLRQNSKKVKERCRIMAELISTKKKEFIDSLISQKIYLNGVLEEKNDDDYWTALSDHYIRIYVKKHRCYKGDYVKLQAIDRIYDGILVD